MRRDAILTLLNGLRSAVHMVIIHVQVSTPGYHLSDLTTQ
jgi:hypothetical protein